MLDPTTALAGQAVTTIVHSSLISSVRNGVIDFLAGQVKDLGKKELADHIVKLRSDAKLREQIQTAVERATKRWANDYPDRDLVLAVADARGTEFADLPSVQQAVQAIAKNPFNPIATETLHGKFAEVLPKRFEPERIERGVIAWLEILREEFAGVPVLRDALAVAAEIQTSRSVENIVAILCRMETGPQPSEQTLRDYLNWVIDQHYYLDPRGTMQTVRQVQVRLQDVYVSLEAEAQTPLSTLDRRLFEHELESLMQREDLTPEVKEDLRENLLARYASEEARPDTKPVELAELICKHARLVILGDPGAGKTTLLRLLALRHAQALRSGESQLADLGPVRLPIYIRIANFAEDHRGRSLVDYVPACVRGEEDSDPAIAALIREWLERGKCLVLLDGLDEVIEPSQRAEIAAQIDSFIRAHKNADTRFVVTSRVAGYRSAPLSGDIPHYCVRDMDDEQIQRFLKLWCYAVERFQTPELGPQAQTQKAQAEIDDIMRAIQSTPGVKRLATDPLLLRVLALIHHTGARLPQRRIELYRLAADTLIRDWELARGIPQTALVREADANRLLAELAAWMHQEKPAGIATEGEAKTQLASVVAQLQGKDFDHPDVRQAADDFIMRIRQHTGLFVERALRRYGFMHLTFEEYFAARWLVARPREAAKRIRNKLHRPRWEEPILLAIGFYGMEFPDDVSELVEEAILGKNLGGASSYEDILHRDLLFAVRVLGDQDVSAGLRRRLLQDFVHLWQDRDGSGRYKPLRQRIERIVATLKGSQAEVELRDALLILLNEESEHTRVDVVNALGNMTLSVEAVTTLLSTLEDKSKLVRASVANVLSKATYQPRVVNALIVALKDEAESVRDRAAYSLRDAPISGETVTALVNALKDEDRDFSDRVIYALRTASLSADAITILLTDLEDESQYVRASIIAVLGNAVAQPEVATVLLKAMKGEQEDVRASAAYALRKATAQREVVSALLTALVDNSTKVRASAAVALRRATNHPEVVAALLAAFNDENETVRDDVILALRGAVTRPEVVMALLAALKDESAHVRESAVVGLGKVTLSAEAIPDLLAALKDTSVYIRFRAATALGNAIDQPEVIGDLIDALKDESEHVRDSAADSLRNATSYPHAVVALLDALRYPRADVRACAAHILGNAVERSEVITALIGALKDEDELVRQNAASALGNAIAYSEAVNALLGVLKDESKDVRAHAVAALETATDQPAVITALLDALKDESEAVRSGAVSALSSAIVQPEVVAALFDALRDESWHVRTDAAEALAQLAHRPSVETSVDFPAQLAAGLKYLEQTQSPDWLPDSPQDHLFGALAAIAPGPEVN